MCGIAGLLYSDADRPVGRNLLAAMGRAIAHRGPDAEGFLEEPGLGLVHRRLAILDDRVEEDQPVGNEDGSVQVILDGQIYNQRELRQELQGRGRRCRTQGVAEVLAHLYEERGEGLIEQLRGMFALAIWDRRERRLLLARDRLGIKPLYVYRDAEKLAFGSELKAILALPDIDRTLDPAALEDYLTYGMVPGPRSIFAKVEKLPPAHTLTVRADDLGRSPRRYWQLRFEANPGPSVDEWAEAVQAKLAESVRLHQQTDATVGAFLSGGIDSGIIVGLAAEAAESPLRTFSIGFHEAAFSELPEARRIAQRYGTSHVEEVITPDALGLIDDLTHHYDEPFADSSAVPTLLVSRLAAREVKVVLSGDGGDEAFGGYARYAHDLKEAAVRRCLPLWFRRAVLGPLASVYPKADWLPRPLRAKTALTNLALEPDSAYANSLALCRVPLRRRLLARDVAAELNGHDPGQVARDGYNRAPSDDALSGMIAADMATLLPDDYLVKVDRASMAAGLEVRPPLLDHELIELAARIPSEYKLRQGQTKWILRRACGHLLPVEVLRRPKQGFEVPIDAWLRGPLRERIEADVLDPHSRVADLIDQSHAARLLRSHLSGASRHGGTLWSLLMLARWADRYLSSHSASR